MKIDTDWILKDSGGGEFCLQSYEIKLDLESHILAQLITRPNPPKDIENLSVLHHEIHHWAYFNCSTFGLFINALLSLKVVVGILLINMMRGKLGKVYKPVIRHTEKLLSDDRYGPNAEWLLYSYHSARRLVDVLLGLDNCDLTTTKALFLNVLPIFPLIREGILQDHNTKLTKRFAQDAAKRFENMFKDASLEEREMEPSPTTEEKFFEMIRNTSERMELCKEDNRRTNPTINFLESLSFYTLLEGSAKYYQRITAEYMYAFYSHGDRDNKERFNGALKLWEWEKWDSIYVRAARTFMETKYGDDREYSPSDLYEFFSIVDLAINPSINFEWFIPDHHIKNLDDFLPAYRFLKAANAAKKVKSFEFPSIDYARNLENLENDVEIFRRKLLREYKRYISDVCHIVGWEEPYTQAARWLQAFHKTPQLFPIYPFLEACKLRTRDPLVFGLPQDFLSIFVKKHFSQVVLDLPFPEIRSKDSWPKYYISRKRGHRSLLSQRVTLMYSRIIDQIMLENGPVTYEFIEDIWKGVSHLMKEMITENMSYNGIDLEEIQPDN